MRVLLFCPASESLNAERLLSILRASGPDANALEVDQQDDACEALPSPLPDYQAVIILYTPALALFDCLFHLVHSIQQRPPVGRFLFLPQEGSGTPIPAIFHPIRRLQMNLYFYTAAPEPPQPLITQMDAFRQDWDRFFATSNKAATASPRARSRRGGWGLLAGAFLFLAILAGLVAWLLPSALPRLRERFAPIPILVRPPDPGPAWLVDSFQAVDPAVWKVQHVHTGRQALQESLSAEGLLLRADSPLDSASLELTGVQAWPLNTLQSLTFSFDLSPLTDGSARASITFGLRLTDDPAYSLDCAIIPGITAGQLQCRVLSPSQQEALSNPAALTLDSRHTVQLVFNPQNYSVKSFLDGTYLGSREIQSVEFWRDRSFQPVLSARLENLQQGSFQCHWYGINITQQPGTE